MFADRGSGDRGISTKPLAFAVDEGSYADFLFSLLGNKLRNTQAKPCLGLKEYNPDPIYTDDPLYLCFQSCVTGSSDPCPVNTT